MSDGAIEDPSGELTERSTGVGSVDTVIRSIEGLDDRPVAEHVAVFEQAHEQLRRALDDAPGA